MILPKDDPTNALHQASFAVEELKYGPGEGKLEFMPAKEIDTQLATLLEAAGVTDITPEELRGAMEYYGVNFTNMLGGSKLVNYSVFIDGVMHGLALAAGLKGKPRLGGNG